MPLQELAKGASTSEPDLERDHLDLRIVLSQQLYGLSQPEVLKKLTKAAQISLSERAFHCTLMAAKLPAEV